MWHVLKVYVKKFNLNLTRFCIPLFLYNSYTMEIHTFILKTKSLCITNNIIQTDICEILWNEVNF